MKDKDKLILAALACFGLMIALIGCANGRSAAGKEDECVIYTRTIQEYTVEPFDSISKISAKFCPEFIDFYQYQDDFRELNNCGDTIYYGEVVKVYVYEE